MTTHAKRGYVRGDYVVDVRPARMRPPSEPWVARVQTPLYGGTVMRVVAPHGAEWPVPVADLRWATPAQCAWFDAHVP